MSATTPRRIASVGLRVRSVLSGVSLLYAIPLRQLAHELTGKKNLKALFDWCAEQGVGVDGFRLNLLPGGSQGQAWLDARRERGVFFDRTGNVAATLVNGKVTGDASLAAWLAVLPSTAPAAWEGAAKAATKSIRRAAGKPEAAAAKATTMTARVDIELTSRAQLTELTITQRKQLVAASKDLCGSKGLAALMRWCDAEGQGLAHVGIFEKKTARFEAWLTGSLEDGVFFDAGKTTCSGLTLSQSEVSAGLRAREHQVAALAKAMSRLKAPRAPKWKG